MKQKLFEKNKKISQKTIIINRSNLTHNYQVIQKEAKNSSIICVVKGDAYGHGMLECSEKLIKNRVNNFYVARLEDALKLRKKFKKIKICVLAGVITKDCCREMIKNQITPIINNFDQLELFKKYNKKNKFILHLDTGMNRLGFQISDLKKIQNIINPNEISIIMSHLSSSDDKDKLESLSQFQKLIKFNEAFNKPLSLCNSAGIFLNKNLHLNFVRPGKSLYGINPFPKKSFGLKPVMSIYAPILQIMSIKKGETIGYSKTFKAKKHMQIATIDFGYSDGLHRSSSNKGKVFINNVACPILGRVSMDLVTIDVSHIKHNNLFLGKPVEIIGKNQTYEAIALDNSTNEHEILISLGKNSKRLFLD